MVYWETHVSRIPIPCVMRSVYLTWCVEIKTQPAKKIQWRDTQSKKWTARPVLKEAATTPFLKKKKVLHDSHLCCFLSSCKDLPPCCSPCPAAYWRWDRVQCLCVHEVLSLVRSRNGRTKYFLLFFLYLKKHTFTSLCCAGALQPYNQYAH